MSLNSGVRRQVGFEKQFVFCSTGLIHYGEYKVRDKDCWSLLIEASKQEVPRGGVLSSVSPIFRSPLEPHILLPVTTILRFLLLRTFAGLRVDTWALGQTLGLWIEALGASFCLMIIASSCDDIYEISSKIHIVAKNAYQLLFFLIRAYLRTSCHTATTVVI